MNFSTTFFGYMKWHYGKALLATFSFWRNMMTFLFNYFSVKNLTLNFFTPFKRLSNIHSEKANILKYIYFISLNTLGAVIEMLLRLILLIIAIAVIIIFIIFLPVSLLVWLLLPVFIVSLLVAGLVLMIFS